MNKTLFVALIIIVNFIIVYLTIAAVLVISGRPRQTKPTQSNLSFKQLIFDYARLPQLQTFTARDGKQLAYRHYSAQTNKILILLHGAAWHSRYFLPLAEFITSQNLAQVYTPDLRGHGIKPERRGDVDYIGQLEDDLADLMAMISQSNPNAKFVIGGHSSGGGLALRFAGGQYGHQASAYLLLSPFLKYNAPTIRPNSGEWTIPYTRRIIGLTMLNNIGIKWFNDSTVIEFNMPKEVRDGTETLFYSYRLNTSYASRDYKKDLRAINKPLLVVVGNKDEAFIADRFEYVISQYTQGKVKLLNGVTHMGLVVGPEIRPVIKEWFESLNND